MTINNIKEFYDNPLAVELHDIEENTIKLLERLDNLLNKFNAKAKKLEFAHSDNESQFHNQEMELERLRGRIEAIERIRIMVADMGSDDWNG